ncbi:MAG: hypothetical protein P857_306 [Candidatus Xenolissoclinum pacificiensis L6]|uniref:Transmembrane protein n=1 Tax=Candidatus Xenolissoclinum pacificiensis L6 TaxID=1401685 RepID=W2UZ30_9RICK|nr:MAG: hypothetical protein P857_306 [Candidatus Xenolissoclinum pacificiensis L6]
MRYTYLIFFLILILVLFLFLEYIIERIKAKRQQKYEEESDEKYHENKKRIIKENQSRYLNHISNIQQSNQDIQNIKIDKPIGKWTQFILSQRTHYFRNLKNTISQQRQSNQKIGLWQAIVEAKSSIFQGREKGRSK